MLGVCSTGAGPSAVAFAQSNFSAVERLLGRAYAREGVACTVRTLDVHQQ